MCCAPSALWHPPLFKPFFRGVKIGAVVRGELECVCL